MTLLMGLVSNKALRHRSRLGLNAVVAFQLVASEGLTMASAMGIILMEGIFITVLVLTGFRKAVFEAIPLELKKAIVIGIGFFILFIGLVDGGIVDRRQRHAGHPGQPHRGAGGHHGVRRRDHHHHDGPQAGRRAILLGIIFSTILATILNYAYDKKPFGDATAVIPKHGIATPDFSLVGHFDFGVLHQARRRGRPPVGLQHHAERLLRHHGHPHRRRRTGRATSTSRATCPA